ncbi:hypothetical protein M9458_002976, partial [Cirrhinus mrigala]
MGDWHWTLKDYIDFMLWVNGSTLTVDEADVDRNISVQPHLVDISQPDPEPRLPSPRSAKHEPKPTVDGEPEPNATNESSLNGATELRIALEPEPITSDQVRELASLYTTAEVTVEREGTEKSPAHCTSTEGELKQDLGLGSFEKDLINFDEDIYADMPPLIPPSSEL